MANTQVEQIKERLDILDIVGGYVELTKAGKHYKGKSPFTSENTPSFFVSPDRGMYYCFSSQKGGDMFTFVEEMEGVDFKGALKILADKAGVELVPEDPRVRDARESQYALLEEGTQYFFKEREKNSDVTEYVEKRGVTGETMHVWRIGYALPEWRALRSHLNEKKFTDAQMLRAGLIKSADGGKEPYDVFRERIVFPMCDVSGRVVAFSGRTLSKDEGVPKYVNSPETEFFLKSEILYGYDKAKQGIRSYDFSLVVEGQFDVVLAHQAGYTNTVAVSGTALTDHHAMLLQRLSNRVVLALDSDRAGIAAVKRSALIMLPRGMDIKVARMEEGTDPADIIQDDPQAFKKVIGGATHVIDFLLSITKEHAKDDRTFKLEVREEILPFLLNIPNRIDREHFEGVIAEAIGTTKEAIHYEVTRIAEDNNHEIQKEASMESKIQQKTVDQKEDLLTHIYTLTLVPTEEYADLQKEVVSHLKELLNKSEYAELEKLSQEELSERMFTVEKYYEETARNQVISDMEHFLRQIQQLLARERMAVLRGAIRDAEISGNEEELKKHLKATKAIEQLLQNTRTIRFE